MKLRNKRTGVIVECESIVFAHCNAFALDWAQYAPNVKSLAELNEEWEDYEPKEPLIKDGKKRKAVRAWAEANDIGIASAYVSPHRWYLRAFNDGEQGIDFWLRWEDNPELIENKRYTIAELCGEEEECES